LPHGHRTVLCLRRAHGTSGRLAVLAEGVCQCGIVRHHGSSTT
jgi:hypothetical protein